MRSNCKLERTGSKIISSSGLGGEKDVGGGDVGMEVDRAGGAIGMWSSAASSEAECGDIMRTVFPALPLDGRGMSATVSTRTVASYQRHRVMLLTGVYGRNMKRSRSSFNWVEGMFGGVIIVPVAAEWVGAA